MTAAPPEVSEVDDGSRTRWRVTAILVSTPDAHNAGAGIKCTMPGWQ